MCKIYLLRLIDQHSKAMYNQRLLEDMIYVNTIERFHIVKDTITLADALQAIQDQKYSKQVQKVRALLAAGKEDEASNVKKKILGFTPSGTFDKRRKADTLLTYNQIVIIDIDKLEPDQVEPLRKKANEHPSTLASFVSPSGLGLKILVKVATPAADHTAAFQAVNTAYAQYLNVDTDPSGKDIPRLCFFSADDRLYYNPDAKVFDVDRDQVATILKTSIDDIVRFTEQKQWYISGNRNNFVHLLACNCSRAGISQSEALAYISLHYADLPSDEIATTVNSAYSKPVNPAKVSSKAPAVPLPKPKKSASQRLQEIETYISSLYDLRFNIVTNRVEYKLRSDKEYKLIDDYIENTILRQLNQANINTSMSKLRSILHSSFVKKYDPFITYFDNLPENQDDRDYIAEMAMTITTEEQDLWLLCFKKWITAMVASLVNPKLINHTVIVFSGRQGIGKTTWMENLVPPELKQYLYSGTINPNNKDTIIQLSECMLINLDELENLNRSEIGSLKEVITKSQIRIRRAYGHNQEHMQRRASFAGSVNTKQFLNDATGSRRFLCFEVTDIQYLHHVPLDRVLAQAYHLYKTGFQHWFDKDEIAMITANNEKYQIRNVSEEMLLTYFRIPEPDESCQYIAASQILSFIHNRTGVQTSQGNIIALGKALNKHGFERVKKSSRYVWKVVPIDESDVISDNHHDPQSSTSATDSSEDEAELPF